MKVYGEVAVETAPFYYRYGNALLEHVMSSSDIFGSAVERAAERQQDALEAEEEAEEEEGDEEESDAEVEAEEEAAVDQEEDAEPEVRPPSVDEDLEVAWELLDAARVIYEKHDGHKMQLAETHQKLGDLSMEMEQFDNAATEYVSCLTLSQELYPTEFRRLATIEQQLGIVSIFKDDVEGALKHYSKTSELLMQRLEQLLGRSLIASSKQESPDDTESAWKTITAAEVERIASTEGREEDAAELTELLDLLKELHTRLDSLKNAGDSEEDSWRGMIHEVMSSILTGLNESGFAPEDGNDVQDLGVISSKRKLDTDAAQQPSKQQRSE